MCSRIPEASGHSDGKKHPNYLDLLMTFLMYFERLGKIFKLADSRKFCFILFIVCFDMCVLI